MRNSNSASLDALPGIADPVTPWEHASSTAWGRYLTEMEYASINRAQQVAAAPTEAVEIGCEGGRWSELLARAGWNLTCIDVNPKTLAACEKRIPTAKCILVDPSKPEIPLPANSVSLVLCIEVAPVSQSNWFMPEAARVLRPGGVVVTTIWNKISFRGAYTRLRYVVKGHKHGEFYRRTFGWFKREAARTGFEIVDATGFCWGPFSRTSNSRLIRPFLAVERALGLRHLASLSPWVNVVARKLP